jgi:ubiquinone/menaquinone biosynthesis C-methylase UbiE
MDASQKLIAEYSARAAEYDRYWAPVIHPMGRPIVSELPLASARRVLDVGAGTGSNLPDLAAAAPGALIFGTDASEGMLRIARSAAKAALSVMDAKCLGLRSETIDVATLVFVLFHVTDPPAGLRDVRRVLKPGGAVGVVVWGRDPNVPGTSIWTEELDRLGAAPDARDPSVTHREEMDTPEKLAALLEGAGFGAVRAWSTVCEHRFTLESVSVLQGTCGMPGRRARSLPEAGRELCQTRARASLARLAPEELVYRPEVVFAVGRRE